MNLQTNVLNNLKRNSMEKKDCYVCVCDGSCTGPEDCAPIIKA